MRTLPAGHLAAFVLSAFTPVMGSSVAQQSQTRTVSIQPAKAAEPYAAESMVITKLSQVYVMNTDGTGYYERTVAARLQSEAAVQQIGVVTLSFAGASEHVEFQYARARHADGTVTETSPTDAIEQPEQVTVQAPFYSDLKQVQLPIKGLKIGDTLEWKAKVTRTKAEAPGQFWGQETFVSDVVTLDETVELHVPADKDVTTWTNPKLGVKPTVTAEAGQRIYRWVYASLKPTVGAEADAVKKLKQTTLLSPEEQQDAQLGRLPSVQWSTFKSWADVGAWYRGLEANRMVPDDAIKAKVAELTAGKTTEEQKVRAVYSYVSSQIRYIGVAFGVGRYQPHQADAVMDNQYGDCKDKHTLLASMLLALGLHPDAVLIGADIRFNPDVPSPASFNHLITRVLIDGKEVWLDSTAEVAPYQMLTVTIRDKQALVVPDSGAAMIERSPKDPPFASFQSWTAKGTLDDKGVSDSHITLMFRGDDELLIRQVLRQVAPAQYEEFTQRLARSIGYAGTTSHAEIGRPEQTDDPLTLKFDYHREQGGDWENYRILPQLAPVSLTRVDEKEPPVEGINLGAPQTQSSHSELTLPTGWGAVLPEAVHEKNPYVSYDLTYRFNNGVLTTDRTVVILQSRVPAQDWKTYQKWQDAVSLGNETYIQLTRKGTSGAPEKKKGKSGDAGPPTEGSYNAKAADLIQQAYKAMREMDSNTAKKLLDQASELNPQQAGLWAGYASVATMLGERNEAIHDLEVELTSHPDEVRVYPLLVDVYRSGRDVKGTEAVLRRWMAADANNPLPPTQLIAMLLSQDKADAALDVADAALKQLPEDKAKNEALQLQVAQAEMAGHREDKGADRLTALLKTSEDPLMLNDAAYALANANLQLPLDEKSVSSALDKLSKESESWTLDEAPATLKQKSSLLVASWDTLGWIYFREGKLTQAVSYIEAAWWNDLHAEVGEHLVEVREAIAKPNEAAKLEAEKPVKGHQHSPEPKRSSQELRTVPLGFADGRDGVAQYRLLISHGKVELAKPSDEKTVDRGAEMLMKADLSKYTPTDSQAKIVRDAMLNCHAGKCDLVFLP